MYHYMRFVGQIVYNNFPGEVFIQDYLLQELV